MKYLLASFSLLVLFSSSCTSTRKIVEEARPPLLQKQETPSEEIQYMFETDQEDRGAEGGFLTVAGRTAKIVRDPEFRSFMINPDSVAFYQAYLLFSETASHHPDNKIRKEADFFGKEAYDRYEKAVGSQQRRNSFSVKLN